MPLSFDLKNRDVLDNNHSSEIYRFNLARNHALLSGNSAVIRRFYRQEVGKLGCKDIYNMSELTRSFFYNARQKNAFVYAGLIPWIVESIVRLVATSGVQVTSALDGGDDFDNALKLDIDEYINEVVEKYISLQEKFSRGVYLESGLGDFIYRISYDKNLSDKPIVDVIEPQYIEIKTKRGVIVEILIKESADDISADKPKDKQHYEVNEIYSKKNGKVVITYKFYVNGKLIGPRSKYYQECKEYWSIEKTTIELPFKDFPLVFKKNNKQSELYLGERGVPDIEGLETIEDALSESLSNLVDCIRKSAPKTFVDEELLPSDIQGNTEEYSAFDHEYLIIKNSGLDPTKLLATIQGKIDYQSHIETAKTLISHAINKVGLSPTTLGVTGLESINSSVDSQDAREKPSLRTRSEKLVGWKNCITELLNKYFMYLAYINGEEIQDDYSKMFNITFNEYINPSTENIVAAIAQAITGRVYSVEYGVEKRFIHEKRDYTLEDIIIESARIRGITPQAEMEMLGLVEESQEKPQQKGQEDQNETENSEGEEPSVFHKENKPTEALNEEKEDARNAINQ